MNHWIFDNMAFGVLHVSAPYKSTDFTFELKIFIVVPLEIFLAFHAFPRMLKMTGFVNSVLYISSSASFNIHNASLVHVGELLYFQVGILYLDRLFTFGIDLHNLGLSPNLIDVSARRDVFSCIWCCVLEMRAISSVKSKSSSCCHIVHWIPFLFHSVDSLMM